MEEREIVFLDTETTGLYNADAIEISIVSLNGNGEKSFLFNSRIKTKKKIENEAFKVHKISNEDLKNAPTFRSVYNKLKKILKNKIVVIYNSNFDFNIINNMCYDIKKDPLLNDEDCFCLMDIYSHYFGEWVEYFEDYKWQKLTTAFYEAEEKIKIHNEDLEKIKAHTALGDCIMSKYVFLMLYGEQKEKINITDFKEMFLKYYYKN